MSKMNPVSFGKKTEGRSVDGQIEQGEESPTHSEVLSRS